MSFFVLSATLMMKAFERNSHLIHWRSAESFAYLFVGLGIIVRIVALFLYPPFWGDEIAVILNLLDRSGRELLLPLDHGQITPIGLLYLYDFIGGITDYSAFALRVPSALAGISALLVVLYAAKKNHISWKLAAVMLSLLALNPGLIRHAVEMKHYSKDMLSAALFCLIFLRQENKNSLWILLAGLFTVTFSFASIFILFAYCFAVCIDLLLKKDWGQALTTGFFGIFWALCFLIFAMFIYSTVRENTMVDFWDGGFIPLHAGMRAVVTWTRNILMEIAVYPMGIGLAGVLVVFTFVGVSQLTRKEIIFFFSLFVVVVLASILELYPIWRGRLVLYAVIPVIYLFSLGFINLESATKDQKVKRSLIVLIAIMAVLPWATQRPYLPRFPVDTAREIINSNPSSIVVESSIAGYWNFYSTMKPLPNLDERYRPLEWNPEEQTIESVVTLIENVESFWLVADHSTRSPQNINIEQFNYKKTHEDKLHRVILIKYSR